MDRPRTTPPTPASQASHVPLSQVSEKPGLPPNAEHPPPPGPITGHNDGTQTDVSTGPKITTQDSSDGKGAICGASADERGPQKTGGSTGKCETGRATHGSSHPPTPLPSTKVSWTPQGGETHPGLVPYTPPGSGNSTPNYSAERQGSESDPQNSPPRAAVEQTETNRAEVDPEVADLSPDLTIRPQSSPRPEMPSTAPTAPAPAVCHLHRTELDLMQTDQPVQVQTADSDTPLASELSIPAIAHGAVVLGGESGLEFSEELQVNQCVFLKEHVSGDAAVVELHADLSAGEPKSFIEGTHSEIGMASLAGAEFEIYSFVEEEIATEVVEDRLSLSPSYEVNLFTPVIEHSESEGQHIHVLSSLQMANDDSHVVLQHGPLTSDHGLLEMEVCSNDFTPTISPHDTGMSDEGQNFQAENTTAEVSAAEGSANICLIPTVPVLDTPHVRTNAATEATTRCPEAVPDHRRVDVAVAASFGDAQTLPGRTGTGVTASTSSLVVPMAELTEELVESTGQRCAEVLSSPNTVHLLESGVMNCPSLDQAPGLSLENTTISEPCSLSVDGSSDPEPCPAAIEMPMQIQQDIDCAVTVTTAKDSPGASQCALPPGIIDPSLLLLKPEDTALLKRPPSFLLGTTRLPSDGRAQTGVSGLDTAPAMECLPEAALGPAPACVSVDRHEEQSMSRVDLEPGATSSSTLTTNTALQRRLSNPAPCRSDDEALTPIKASPGPAGTVLRTLDPPDAPPEHFSGHMLPSTSGSVSRGKLFGYSSDGGQAGPPPVIRPRLAGVKGPGFGGPKDESSDGEDDLAEEDKASHRSMGSPGGAESKVRQWIADRVTPSSSPVSPGPDPSSSSDWTPSTTPIPLRGAHGRFLSPPTTGPGGSSPSDPVTPHRPRMERHADMAELAKHEAEIEGRTLALKKEGFWSMKRLTRLTEPVRTKVHWDYLCEEMQWLSADFAQERRWKRGVARKVVRMVMRHHEDLRQKEEKAKRDEHAKIRRVASNIAKEVRAFWSSVEKVVQYKQQSRLEEKRKKALDLQLDFIVGQTEKYSDLLSQALETAPAGISEPASSPHRRHLPPAVDEEDRDFEPPCGEEEDDEETIDVEEAQDGNDAETQRREIELLRQEGTMSLAELLSTLKRPQSQDSEDEEECSDNSSTTVDEDEEFTANEEDAEDEEDTIAAQEIVEGEANHADELDDLAKEGDMSMEELLEKYKGAYASDFEEPSTSASPASSDQSENSGEEDEEEEESEEDESDVESNTNSSSSGNEDSEEEEVSENEEDSNEDECDEGMEILLKEGDHSPPLPAGQRPKKEISHIAATAESLQPKGYTLATTKVKTPIPFLLVGQLREYQHIGLDWLVTMYEKKLNGILADEMGLGKTIQTIALLAHLACEKGNWGPHLIIVPTSVMLNWEMELKRWCPGFKILTYYGSQKERKLKRQGWTKPNAFHVCITSYKLVLQDHQAFRRKSWRYLILDEAQNIKNFKSQRWQSLLNFNSQRRLLLTGTPLQNSLMELWSLMHFLMPHVFQSHREFKEWFSNPLTGMIEGSQEYNEGLVKRLHKVLRPFLLRRIKADVEKQMPKKYEHVVRCRLSKRQRFLYDDFMAQASTRETLASGHFMSVINILMQLRKVCNHPNLFDPRPIHSPFITKPIIFHTASLVQQALEISPFKRCDLSMFDLLGLEGRVSRYQADVFLPRRKVTRRLIQEVMESPEPPPRPKPVRMKVNRMFQPLPKADSRTMLVVNNPRPTCPVTPAAQALRPPSIQEVTTTPTPSSPVQQAVCSVAPTAPPRPPTHPGGPSAAGTAARAGSPMPVVAVRPPTSSGAPRHPTPPPSNLMTQRVLLSPDMQARLPSGEVVSIAQLASLAGRPVSSCQGSKPVTFQLQGNKLTLSGTQLHQVPVAPARPVQGNVMHLVTSGGQHHLISQPAQVAVFSSASTHAAASPAPSGIQLPVNSAQVPSSMVTGSGIVKIVVRQSSKEGGGVPTLAVPPSPRLAPQASPSTLHHANPALRTHAPLQTSHRHPGPATAQYTLAPPRTPTSVTIRTSTPAPPRTSTPAPPRIPTPAPSRTPAPPRIPTPAPPRTSTPAPPRTSTPAPPRIPTSAPGQSPNPQPVQKAEKGPAETSLEQKARVNSSSSSSSREDSSETKSAVPKSGSHVGGFVPPRPRAQPRPPPRSPFFMSWLAESRKKQRDGRLTQIVQINDLHCSASPVYGYEVLDFLTFLPGLCPTPARQALGHWGSSGHAACLFAQSRSTTDYWDQSSALREAIHTTEDRLQLLQDVIERFTFVIPPVEAPPITLHTCHPPPSLSHQQAMFTSGLSALVAPLTRSLHRIQCNMRTHFPDLRLIQYDCGKLQTLHTLLRRLKEGQHRVLIFTQMTRMLDVLEQFLNYHGHIYLRLDGSTRIEQRQSLMDRFNADRRIFCFILSTRSGGVGVNLTGADTVVFYDSDWNPTMDAQAQDRCHRIGQTRDVHIYRLISERTVEENILKKANQKRMLGDMAIEGGNFTTAFFKQQTIRELFDVTEGEKKEAVVELTVPQPEEEEAVNKQSTTILEQALCRAEDEEDIVAASQAKAEQVAELAEFNEAIPLDEAGEGRDPEEEELSKAEQEIAALVEQLTPIERYAMNFLEASLEDVCKEELKQAEEQVEAARKGLDQAKEEGLKLHAGSSDDDDEDDFSSQPAEEPSVPGSGRRPRKHREKGAPSTRTSGRLRGTMATSPEPEPDREVPDRLRPAPRARGGTKDTTTTPSRTEHLRPHAKTAETSPASPSRDLAVLPHRNKAHSSSVPSTATSPPTGKPEMVESDTRSPRREKGVCASPESTCPVDHQSYSAQARDDDSRDQESLLPPSVCSRSPRKRQSADGEVLLGLPEHSPSAKVLRKLPGRLVTVVEEKEPRKRRRRGSGTGGGSSEEMEHAESGRDSTPLTPDKTNQIPRGPTLKYFSMTTKLAEDQEFPSTHSVPPRGFPPYSPPHHSPDMPVLRNLPVRQRLESESRVAAQLGEQGLGRGRGGNYHRKMEVQPGKDCNVSPGTNVTNSTPPVKRKRGRPPKTPPRVAEPQPDHVSHPQPNSPCWKVSPPLSPKRKRGRPRKDSTVTEAANAAQKLNPTSNASQAASLRSNPTTAGTNVSQAASLRSNPTTAGTNASQAASLRSNPTTAATNASQAAFQSNTAAADTKVTAPSASTLPETVASSAVSTSQGSLSTKAVKPDTKAEAPTKTTIAILAPSPAQVSPTSAVLAPSPAEDSPTMAVLAPSPAQVSPAVAVLAPSPAQVSPAVAVLAPSPAQVSPAVAVLAPSPAQVSPAVAVLAPSPAQVSPAVAVLAPSPAQVSPAVAVLAPSPAQDSPAVAVLAPSPAQDSPAVAVLAPSPAQDSPAVAVLEPSPAQDSPAVAVLAPSPAQDSPAVAVLAPSPAQDSPALAVLAPSPAEDSPTMAVLAPSLAQDSPAMAVLAPSPAQVPIPISLLSPTTVPALTSASLPSSDSPITNLPTVSTTRQTLGPASRSTSGHIRIPTAVLTSTLAQFLTSRPRVTTSPPISITTTTEIFSPTANKITTLPLAQITIPRTNSAQISQNATSASTSAVTPTPDQILVKPSASLLTVTAHVPLLTSSNTTSTASLPTPASTRLVNNLTLAPTTVVTGAPAKTSIPTSTKITCPSPNTTTPTTTTPAPMPITKTAATLAPTPTVTNQPVPTKTSTPPATPALTPVITNATPALTTTINPTATLAPTQTTTTTAVPNLSTIPEACLTTTVTPVSAVVTTTITPTPPPVSTTTITPTPPPVSTTTVKPSPTPVSTTTVKPSPTPISTTTVTPSPTSLSTTSIRPSPTPIPTRTITTSQVSNSTKIQIQISTPASIQVLPMAQIPLISTLSSNSTAVAARVNQALETGQNKDSGNRADLESQEAKEDKKTKEAVEEMSDSQLKKRKADNSAEAKDTSPPSPILADSEAPVAPLPEEADVQKVEERAGDDIATSKKRPLSRQSSQESVRSTSPSSVCSTSTPTHSSQQKKSAGKRAPAKRRRGEELPDQEKGKRMTEKESTNSTLRTPSRSSSSDSDTSKPWKDRRFTRSAQSRPEKEGNGESNGRRRRSARSSKQESRAVSNNTGTGESGSETSSIRVTRKSSVLQPNSDGKPQTNSVPSTPPQPEVLGKRCSALNAAAKLLAMRGRVDTPGSRKDPAAKTGGHNSTPTSSDKRSKPKSAPATPQAHCNSKAGSSKLTAPVQSSRNAARSTRQCPGALVPPLETDSKRGVKKEEKYKDKKTLEGKEEAGERDTRSSRGHSACSSGSSDGGGSSRSSSTSGSQRTHSLSSQSTGPRRNRSLAPSSGSEGERSTERGRRRSHRKEGEGRGRETRKERKERHAQKRERLSQEGNAGSGEGTPDRVLRSVAAMAAAQARTPAANTRSSRSSSAQHNKT
ncbi:helicase SRCAP [Esox lucius]|uniref:Snf2-related CREBBP activator protein n=1 Tax=Esox lucius TaxID=8010 RepID=A0AAY5JXV2_ESOLU|nr:helicase SRCAP [Esox lucius]